MLSKSIALSNGDRRTSEELWEDLTEFVQTPDLECGSGMNRFRVCLIEKMRGVPATSMGRLCIAVRVV